MKGKFETPLAGDWSVEKLARYISKNMPEDKPGKCTGPDADAVARYIHDAFFSREARARLNPPRVELVRLTNRQYVSAVTDLVAKFAGEETPVAGERGLQGSYFNSRNIRHSGDATFQRVDRQVNFQYGTNFPDGLKFGTNGFAINWRGTVRADETGEHQFSLRTPNGARLWINGEDAPLVDGSVASGIGNEPRGVIRLIAGRTYPLRLEFYKTAYNFRTPKDPTASISLQWKPPHGVQVPVPARNLSTGRAAPTFILSTPFPPDDSSMGYERGVGISKSWDEAATQSAIEVAEHVANNLDRLSGSKPGDADRAATVESFCAGFVGAAFRRPLSEDQKRLLIGAHFNSAPKLEDAVRRVVMSALKSPRFLYLGLDNAKADDFTVAERLAFGLWDSLPDAELLTQAAQGRLRTREQVERQARRMLDDPRARAKMQVFLRQWLRMNEVEVLAKDAALYPGFTPEIIADLKASLELFLEEAVWSGSSDYRRLLLASDLYVNERLAQFYGVKGVTSDEFVKVALDPRERAGVVTHPYLLSAFAYPKTSSPIHRGVFLTRNIVGRALRPPVMAIAFKDVDFAPDMTMREKIAELTRSQACQSCHSVINPLGFSLEQYDAVGRFRTHENGRPVNPVSDYLGDDGETVRLSGARDLAEFAAANEQAHSRFVEQLFHHVAKQPMLAFGTDTLDRVRRSFAASGFNVRSLLVEVAATSSLHGLE